MLRLDRTTLYGLPALPVAALGLPLYLQLPAIYSEQIALATLGFALLAARMIDLGGDAAAGWVSDRWPWPRWRRRGPMLLGVAILLPASLALLRPPAEAGALYLFVWASVAYSGWSLLSVPYSAWASELGANSTARRQLTALREGSLLLGTLLALGLLATHPDEPQRLLWLLPLVPLAILPLGESESRSRTLESDWRTLLRTPEVRRLLLAYFINACANALPATLFLLYVEHRLGAPSWAGSLLLCYFAAGILALPLWLKLARRIGAASAWRLGLYLACLGFAPAAFLGSGDAVWFLLICLATGACLGADLALPASLHAELAHRHGHAGALFAAWGMATKLALALAAGIALPLLALAGFNAVIGDDSLPLALLYAAAPIPIKLLAARLIAGLPEVNSNETPEPVAAVAGDPAGHSRL